ncbi:MAG: dihydrofolate reductase [Opitutaceae bacterium]|nr:dihydrofolate reductase [Opitutaceae bacterium]
MGTMKKTTLYIAASLDGFIARTNGDVDWLPVPVEGGEDYGYAAFLDTVDTLVMGRKSYEQSLTFGPWPYGGRRCVVFSGTRGGQRDAQAEFVDGDIAACVRELKAETGQGGIWLFGGAEVVAACLAGDVVDEIILTTVPVLLGEGIRLFPETTWMTRLRLEDIRSFADGLVQQRYAVVVVRECEELMWSAASSRRF